MITRQKFIFGTHDVNAPTSLLERLIEHIVVETEEIDLHETTLTIHHGLSQLLKLPLVTGPVLQLLKNSTIVSMI